MVVMTEASGCGNAPRHQVIRDLVLALAEVDEPRLNELLAEKVHWEIPGAESTEGLAGLTSRLVEQSEVEQITLNSIITHGREGGADGVLDFRDGSRLAFCHMLKFASTAKTAKVTLMRSYLIDLAI